MFNPDFYSFFKDVYNFAQSVPAGADSAYTGLIYIADVVVILGLGLALILLVMNVYVSIRLEQLEHAGFHHREMAEHLHHQPEYQPQVKNKRWEGIVLLANSPNESDWRRAILDADILLSEMLRDKGYTGKDIGEQFMNANPLQFTTIDIAREAHRMRNALAHLGEAFPLSERDARATIDQYRRVFEEFDYI
jgi:hypothetical protein